MVPKEVENFIYEKRNVLNILHTAIKAIKRKNFYILKDLSNRTVHSASIYQDTDSITVAVIIYALSKVFERSKYSEYEDWAYFSRTCINALIRAKKSLKRDDVEGFRNGVQEIRAAINDVSGNLKKYVEEVFRKAMINKASRLYEHGISMKQTAELLGISEWELAEYAGATGISDVNLSVTMDVEKRIGRALDLFD